jgi:NAD(P)-dependent dehydrogenase (short-subunit alcohol dehydrogenase family)
MRIVDSVIVVTGAGSGIGAGLARRFVDDGAAAVIIADRDRPAAERIAAELGAKAHPAALDVTSEAEVSGLVAAVLAEHGRIDLFCSNAGVSTGVGLESGPAADAAWALAWDVHLMAHVYAARAVVPAMIAAGGGYLVNTASAAGLLTAPGDAPYSVTKHAAVAFAEWLAIEHAAHGIKVSVLCPMGVQTPLLMQPLAEGNAAAKVVAASAEIIGVDQVAEAVVEAVTSESFLILPHPEVGTFWAHKAADVDRWLAGMSRVYEQSRRQAQVEQGSS